MTFGKDGGTGLGLAFVKHVAQGHGGEAQYLRENGKSVFEIILRDVSVAVRDEVPVVADEVVTKIDGATVKDRKKILIKLEDQDQQDAVVEQLRSMGHEVTTSVDDLSECGVYYSDDIGMLDVSEPGVHPIVSFGESTEVIVNKVTSLFTATDAE